MEDNTISNNKNFPATIVKVIDNYTVAINRGKADKIYVGDEFLIYGLSDEKMIDPETEEDLGFLEIFKGNGKVINVQDRLALIKSIEKKKSRKEIIEEKSNPFSSPFLYSKEPTKKIVEFPEENLPFKNPKEGDKAKPI